AQPGPILSDMLEVPERPGLFLAGDVTGGALIRNAILQGTSVAETVAARSKPARPGRNADPLFDLAVIGAGPAGLSAALRARERGLSVIVFEQASIAESIRRFSRGKLVLDTPSSDVAELPLWIADASKEQLLQRWERAVRSAHLDVREGARVLCIEPEPSSVAAGRRPFRVTVQDGAPLPVEHRARHVLVAVGSRGTPRKLPVPVPERLEPRVHYELSDARAFAGQRLIVVGLGDVAMETALALAAQPGSDVSVVHRGPGFRRGKRRNIDALSSLAARGRVELHFSAEVHALQQAGLLVNVGGAARNIPFDAVFVHIGTVPAHSLLRAAGVCFRE
ncbi:MAG TPA: NAD(P)/FAD-dependent oxidoreductase, partial [Polyangiaceae bacterium]